MPSDLVEIVFPTKLERTFTYRLPAGLENSDLTGCRVLVTMKNRLQTGIVFSYLNSEPEYQVLAVEEVIDLSPVVSKELMTFLKWLADYYLCGLGEALKAALPNGSFNAVRLTVLPGEYDSLHTILTAEEQLILDQLSPNGIKLTLFKQWLTKLPGVESKLALQLFNRLRKTGLIRLVNAEDKPLVKEKKVVCYSLDGTAELLKKKIGPREIKLFKLLEFLSDKNGISRTELLATFSAGIIKKALDSAILKQGELTVDRLPGELSGGKLLKPAQFKLSAEQNSVVDTIKPFMQRKEYQTFLVHGVTGSGKTAVYIELIKTARAEGRSAIVLIPEISLTPQTVSRFQAEFGSQIAVLHSRLSDGERYDSWRLIKDGRFSIVIGPRSAIFAPLDNLGIIIVDEEHESTYKQVDSNPRYHARSAAIIRARLNRAVVVLGSATPSLESYYNCQSGKFQLLEMKERVPGAQMPVIELVDCKTEKERGIFSRKVLEAINSELEQNKQVIVFQNRRGYAGYIKCRKCSQIIHCPHCSVSLTYHYQKKELVCHYCGYFEKAVDNCRFCGDENLMMRGVGTEQIEMELQRLFPNRKVLRMDLDTTQKKGSHTEILRSFEKLEADILVGTQMIAKGLDFPNVTLVCIINVDLELFYPDFRSDERAYQIISQVAGRAGRSLHPGKVLIQTYSMDNAILKYAANQDFNGFLAQELKNRQEGNYPPYCRLARVLFLSVEYSEIESAATQFYTKLVELNPTLTVYPPVDNMISKINKIFRMTIILKASLSDDPAGQKLRNSLQSVLQICRFGTRSKLRVVVDIDPAALG